MSFYTAKSNVFFGKQIVARKVNKQQNEVVIAATTDPHKGVNTSKKRPDGNISSVKVREKNWIQWHTSQFSPIKRIWCSDC